MIRNLQIRHALALAIVALLLVVGGLVLKNLPRGPALEEIRAPLQDADLALQAFEYTETRAGRRQWTIEGDAAGYRQDVEEALIENLRVFFFDDAGEEIEVTLTARHGRIDLAARELRVWEDVVVRGGNDYILQTQSLEYRDANKTAATSEPVRILSPGADVRGRGMRMDVVTRQVEILSEVHALIAPQLFDEGTP
ncbi:LPS export ABC transporter periplasmic protein LptC [Geoalkalibacter halelectricus]|uniref:LPS export ABC transporter periplasmic protein LptC n=1 Tax=Geoalkalibacter halelectricus TaxID=2847045 RepID=A0ABY5ZHY3_9BACT|nr:LPS export ABC transporter periplasmic protein LptC [Geoalkalibacter halelectricus]MDO3379375.1 LPS export ABC transporter periplasmic protein LptC [Geoalkalibacter halelectricus]UWZ78747.1 LPS export ABC transporter periplasmic protein LptC [Geoalkalibacter halelectricus]